MTPSQLNEWRVIPRIIVALYGYMFYEICVWFMSLPEPTTQQAGFVSTIVGSGAAFFGLYVNAPNSSTKTDI